DHAERAASALRIGYAGQQPVVDPADLQVRRIVPDGRGRVEADKCRGDADAAFAAAPVRVDVSSDIGRQNHHPMEPHATIASWVGDRLTLWSKSQFVANEQAEIAAVFDIPAGNVQVICPFVGGAFGTSLRTWPHVTLAAIAARHVRRPVKLVLSRRQMSCITGHRPRTLARVALGATREGMLTSIIHVGTGETSRYVEFVESLTSATSMMYACPNVRTTYRLSPLDTGTPTYMRGPGEASGIYALETAVDELAYKLGVDPIEFRRMNEPSIDEGGNRPFSSRSLMKCYALGADRFGWTHRDPVPGAMRDGRLLAGWGTATATYPALQFPASACARLFADGSAEVESAASDMGPGTYTSMTQVAAETLGLPLENVRFKLGNSDFPFAPPHGGSQTMAAVGSAVRAACVAVQNKVGDLAAKDRRSPVFGANAVTWANGRLTGSGGQASGLGYGEIIAAAGGAPVEAEASVSRDDETANRYSMHAFGAVFVEVTVDPDVGIARVKRALGVYSAGRIVNPRLARSQCIGGMVGGIGMALMEHTILDSRDGRPVNSHMADYLLPVNLDIPDLDVAFVDEVDPHVNPLGVKGLGEISLVGMAPAIANAVFHATGRRIYELPIRLEHLLDLQPFASARI
ncbi:MAG: xanthine dehydrogenase family protein molybdopterin-binding subunit, partial [Hyphomicrobiaceae bacterium]